MAKRYCSLLIMCTHFPLAVIATLVMLIAIVATPIYSFAAIWSYGIDAAFIEPRLRLMGGGVVIVVASGIAVWTLEVCNVGIDLWRQAQVQK